MFIQYRVWSPAVKRAASRETEPHHTRSPLCLCVSGGRTPRVLLNLARRDYILRPMTIAALPPDPDQVLRRCPIMSGLRERHGPARLNLQPAFPSLVDAIASQQI